MSFHHEPESERIRDSGKNISDHFVYSDMEWAKANQTSFHRGSRGGRGAGYRLLAWSWCAALIDGLLILGSLCLVTAGFALYLGNEFREVLNFLKTSNIELRVLSSATLIAGYVVMLRIFLGYTIGEWACGLRLGYLAQRLERMYSLKVIARTALIFVTGFFVLPILSLALGSDIPGKILKLPLIEKI